MLLYIKFEQYMKFHIFIDFSESVLNLLGIRSYNNILDLVCTLPLHVLSYNGLIIKHPS